ncbi:MAG: aminotransferase class IV family protein [Acidobacteriota bacterium]|nr:aminotransferase class IV family protein [Acidobacteriota bacterium]
MDKLIDHNGRIIPLEDARLSPGQAGLLLGWGVFTTLQLCQGHPFEFGSHYKRMARDAKRLNVPLEISEALLLKRVIDLAHENQRADGMARVSIVRNSGGSWGGGRSDSPADSLIFTQPMPSWPAFYRLQVQPGAVFSSGALAGAKMLSWAPNSSFMERARAAGCDDALLLNEFGRVAECTSANIFVVRGGKISTPPLSSGCLPGVTREILLRIAPEAGLPMAEEEISVEMLDGADELFISSTTRAVGAVREIAGRREYPVGGGITRAVKSAFGKYLESRLSVRESGAR